MAETKINASQTTITASDIGAASTAQLADKQDIIQYSVMPTASADNVGAIVQFIGASGSQIKFDVVDSDLTPDNPTVSVDVSKLSGLTLGDSGSLMVSYEVSENDGYIAIVDSGEDTIQSDEFGTPEEAYASVGLVFSATPAFAEVSYSSQTYTNGYFYKSTESSGTYSWVQTDVQAAPSGLPDQTGQSGKFLTTDGTDASWSDKPLVNNATSSLFPDTCLSILGQNNNAGYVTTVGVGTQASGSGTAVGYAAKATGQYGVAVGRESSAGTNGVAVGYHNTAGNNGVCLGDSNSMSATGIAVGNGISSSGFNSISIGFKVGATAVGAIQLGGNYNLSSNIINNETGTFKVCLSTSIANTFNYKLLDIDGTIPEARLADTTNATAGQVLTLDSNLNAVWATPSGGGASSATATLAVNDWSSNTQTVNVTGVTASNNVIVAAAPASQADYTSAGILCTAQGAGTLTFTCTTVPSSAITVNVLII